MKTEPNESSTGYMEVHQNMDGSVHYNHHPGLTKLEHFASQNMVAAFGELLKRVVSADLTEEAIEKWAKVSVRGAKALIKALKEEA